MLFGGLFNNLWGYPSDEPFLQGEPSDLLKFYKWQASQSQPSYEEMLKKYPKEPEQSAQKEPNGIIIDGEYEDITNKRALPGENK